MEDLACLVCPDTIPCKTVNEINLSSHFAGRQHARQAVKLYKTMRMPDTQTIWRNFVLVPTKAEQLTRGHVVLIMVNVLVYDANESLMLAQLLPHVRIRSSLLQLGLHFVRNNVGG